MNESKIKWINCLHLAVNAIGIIGNLLLIIAHVKDPLKHFKLTSSIFIFIIAVIDLLCSCSLLLWNLYLSTMVQVILNVLMGLFHSLSFIMFLSLAIERFCSIAFPFWHRVHITARVCRYWVIVISLVWMLVRVGVVILKQTTRSKTYDMGQIVFLWITFLLTQSVYIASYISIKTQNTILQRTQDMNVATMRTIKLRLKNENNFLVTIAIVCLMLAVMSLPFLTMAFILVMNLAPEYFNKRYDLPDAYLVGMLGIGINCAINVPIYLWRFPKYRKTFKRMYFNC